MRPLSLLEGRSVWAKTIRWIGWGLLAVAIYSGLVLIYHQSPWSAIVAIWDGTLGSQNGFQEVLESSIPLIFCALAVTIPARVNQVNVGGEGQLWIGAMCATFVALTFDGWPWFVLLPAMAVAGAVGGGIWAAVPGWLKARSWMNEVFSTVLLNYIAILVVTALVFGPWKNPRSGNYPQSRFFVPAARLPYLGGSAVDVSIIVAVVAIIIFDLVLHRSRWGLELRAAGANPNAAARMGVPIRTLIVSTMFVGGALAGFAGMAQVSAVQGALNSGFSPGYGYFGFLVSWLAGHNPRLIVPMAFLIAMLTTAGTSLQITLGIPPEIVNVLTGAVMLLVLAGRAVENRMAWT